MAEPGGGSGRPGHPPGLVGVFAVHSKGPKVSSCGRRELWSDWGDAWSGLGLRWVRMWSFVGFVMLICSNELFLFVVSVKMTKSAILIILNLLHALVVYYTQCLIFDARYMLMYFYFWDIHLSVLQYHSVR